MFAALVCALALLRTSRVVAQGQGSNEFENEQMTTLRYTREMVEMMRKQVELAKLATEQLSTMMGPRIGTHFTDLAGYCAHGVSVTGHWNVTPTDCLYECLTSDDCAGYNFYAVRNRLVPTTRCELVTVSLFCGIEINADCTMYIRRWKNNQFGTLFSGSRIASAVSKTEPAPSMSECVGICKRDSRCMHVSYRQPDQTCTLHATGGGATIEDFSWIAYGKVVRCPDFYIRFHGSCFRANKGMNETWAKAQSLCKAEGSHLVNIHSNDENQFVLSLISREAPGINWWIGAYEINGDWRWADTPEPEAEVNFQYWADSTNSLDSARCAYYDMASQHWDRAACDGGTSDSDKFYFVCEAPASQLNHPFAAI